MKKPHLRRKPLFAAALIGLLLVAGAGAWWLWNKNKIQTDSTTQTTVGSGVEPTDMPGELPDTVVTTPEPNPDPNVPGGSTGSNASGTAGPAVPAGAFVSNHKPSLSSPGRNQVASACNSTEGATCVISFTKGGVTKSLQAKQTDENGSVTWEWTLQQLGLTAGSWKIKAAATLNGQTKTAEDPLTLDVEP